MPLIATKGAASAQGFGEFAQTAAPVYIEDVFSTYLYAGTSANQTITNGVDLSGKGGLVWIKARDLAANNVVFDSARGEGPTGNYAQLFTDSTAAQTADPNNGISSFNANGFSLTNNEVTTNRTGYNYVSWAFRKQPKFFDVVTYTGNGSNRTIAHNLGSVPGCIIVKRTDASGFDWAVYHTSTGNTQRLLLNTTDPAGTSSAFWNNTTPTSTVFTVGTNVNVNASGGTYVAYLFAHDAGGFGANGDQNVISCGSVTSDGSGNVTANIGYEPQWILLKTTGVADSWYLYDNLRGISAKDSSGGAINVYLTPNTSDVEALTAAGAWSINQTGFSYTGGFSNRQFIYIAIRRGPMKTPEIGTQIFSPVAQNASAFVTTNFPVDLTIVRERAGVNDNYVVDRLRGDTKQRYKYLFTNLTSAETAGSGAGIGFDSNTGFEDDLFGGSGYIYWNFRRAPGFFDVVCYTGTGSNTTVSHSLGVAPEFMAVKRRDTTSSWGCQHKDVPASKNFSLNLADPASNASTVWNSTAATSSSFSVGTNGTTNANLGTYVAYLFASVAGVSKVGSYTGTGTTLQINCGFTAGARFVLIKRTDDTGDWYVWDSARGIVAGNDPYLLLNSTAAEVTNTDYVDTYSAGFEISSTAPAAINANGGTFIFLAIA